MRGPNWHRGASRTGKNRGSFLLVTVIESTLPPGLVCDLLHWREEILEDRARAEVDLGADQHLWHEAHPLSPAPKWLVPNWISALHSAPSSET